MPSRRRLASAPRMMWCRDSPASLGPSPIGIRTLVATSTSSRSAPSAWPRISSDRPLEYTSAVSKRLTPASRARPDLLPRPFDVDLADGRSPPGAAEAHRAECDGRYPQAASAELSILHAAESRTTARSGRAPG